MGEPKFSIFLPFPLISGHFAPVVDSRNDQVAYGTVRFRREFLVIGCHGCRMPRMPRRFSDVAEFGPLRIKGGTPRRTGTMLA